MTWAEDRKSVEWEEKKKEVDEDSDGECAACGAEEHLTVHHGYYAPRARVWEYDNATLWNLCVKCHRTYQEDLFRLQVFIGAIHPTMYRAALKSLEDCGQDWRPKFARFEVDREVARIMARFPQLFGDYHLELSQNDDLGQPRTRTVVHALTAKYPQIQVDVGDVEGGPPLSVCTVTGPIDEVCEEIRSEAESLIEKRG